LTVAASRLHKGKIFIHDASDQTIEQIKSTARRLVKQHGIKLFVLDYIQLLETEDERLQRDRVRELAKISKAIISLKKTLKVPWIVLAQMNRNIEQAESKRVPILSDLKDCGSLEQDADKVALLYRPKTERTGKDDDGPESNHDLIARHFVNAGWAATPSLINLMVAKNRQGPTGLVELLFFNNQTRFEDLRRWKVQNKYEAGAAGESYKSEPYVEDNVPMTNEEMGM
jgi:replicative DNA helicase